MELGECKVCGAAHHHLCATENKILSPIIGEIPGRFCFDCTLLAALVTKKTPCGLVGAKALFGAYYEQVDIASLDEPTPRALGGMLTTGALTLKDAAALVARLPPPQAKCAKCKDGAGELRACSFCAAVYHDTAECLGQTRGAAASYMSELYPWCCPKCFEKGKAAWAKKKLDKSKAPTKRKAKAKAPPKPKAARKRR